MKQHTIQALAELRERQARSQLDVRRVRSLSALAAEAFLTYHSEGGGYLAEAVTLLCELATLEDPLLRRVGAQGLFGLLIERLSDTFDPSLCALYDSLFAQVVDFVRRLPVGGELDAALRRFGLRTAQDLLARKERLRARGPCPTEGRDRVRKVLVPSRVTIGAEVAVTSVVMRHAQKAFPRAEIVLLAPPQMGQLFHGDRRVRLHPVSYEREGDLVQRLNAWLDLLRAVDAEIAGLEPEEYLAIDPDSRLTQLGLLPLFADDERYYFFESRGYRKEGAEAIAELTAAWLVEHFGGQASVPYLALSAEDLAKGRWLCQRLRQGGAAHIVTVNWGVGDDERKRAGPSFEGCLLNSLLEAGSRIVLARGVGRREAAWAQAAARAVAGQGWRVARVDRPEGEALNVDLIIWGGELGFYCALIAASDLYIGYDSAGQHIAAALGVPTIDIFVDRARPLVAKRWRPCGPGSVRVVMAPEGPDRDEHLLAQVMACYRELRESRANESEGGCF